MYEPRALDIVQSAIDDLSIRLGQTPCIFARKNFGTDGFSYSDSDSQNIYVYRFFGAYYLELYENLTALFLNNPDIFGTGVNAVSLGCGTAPDYVALKKVCRGHGIERLSYTGFDVVRWNLIVQYQTDDGFTFCQSDLKQGIERIENVNLLIFSKSLRDIFTGIGQRALESFIRSGIGFADKFAVVISNAGPAYDDGLGIVDDYEIERMYDEMVLNSIKSMLYADKRHPTFAEHSYSPTDEYLDDPELRKTLSDFIKVFKQRQRCDSCHQAQKCRYNPVLRKRKFSGHYLVARG
jgi:hypothetical protein